MKPEQLVKLYKIIQDDVYKVETGNFEYQNVDFISKIFFPVNSVIQIQRNSYIIENFISSKLNIPGGNQQKINTIFKSTVHINVYKGDKPLKGKELTKHNCIRKAKDLDEIAKSLNWINEGDNLFMHLYGKDVIKNLGSKKKYKDKKAKLAQYQKDGKIKGGKKQNNKITKKRRKY